MKPWYQSKTIAVNALTLLIAVAMAVSEQQWIGESGQEVILMMVSAANLALRWVTTMPISAGTN